MPARRKHIPKETLQHLYLEQGLSPKAIGQQLGCGETAVRKRLKEYNIPMRSRSQAIRLGKGIVIERKTLVELYWGQNLSIPEVATRLDCSEDVVRSRMQEYDISRRTPSESALLNRGIDLPEDLAREWYTGQQLSTAAIAERLGCSETAVRNKLAQYGIERREPWIHNAVKLSEDELRHLYEEEGSTLEAIAEAYDCSAATVSRKMSKFGITARPPWRERYPRHNFSGDPLEKAYLVGFRLGDLTVRRAELSIEVIMTTTCQEQVDLMYKLFDHYGHVYEHHRPDTKIFMQVRLNDSFSFLIPKEDRIPDWVLADKECFFAFFAGYVDAEGSIQVDRRGFARFNLNSYDKILLSQAQAKLVEAGVICPPLRLDVPAGRCNSYGIISPEDYWGFSVNKKTSLNILFARLSPYLKHHKRRQDLQRAWENVKGRMQKRKS
jgi:transposase